MLRSFESHLYSAERKKTNVKLLVFQVNKDVNCLYFKSTALLFPHLFSGDGNRQGWWVWNQLDVTNGQFLGWKWGRHWPRWE